MDTNRYLELSEVATSKKKKSKAKPEREQDLPIQTIFRRVTHRDMNEAELRAFRLTKKRGKKER